MFKLFKKKKKEENEISEENAESKSEESSEKKEAKPQKPEKKSASENGETVKLQTEITKINTDLEKIKASQEAFQEVRKTFMERFNRISEQIGELRAMILERDRGIQEIELKAIKASDLVKSVQPEKLMTQTQKQNAKLEALKANLEGNEAIMARVMDELKETRKKLEFLGGIDEIIKLSEEVKKELIEIKKVEGRITMNADKVETLYAEIRKKFQDIDIFKDEMQEIKVSANQNSKDVDFLKSKVSGLAEKSEVEALVSKVQRYVDALKELEKKSSLTKDIEKLKTILESLK